MEEQGFKYARNFVIKKKLHWSMLQQQFMLGVNKYVLVPNQIHFTLREGSKNRFMPKNINFITELYIIVALENIKDYNLYIQAVTIFLGSHVINFKSASVLTRMPSFYWLGCDYYFFRWWKVWQGAIVNGDRFLASSKCLWRGLLLKLEWLVIYTKTIRLFAPDFAIEI